MTSIASFSSFSAWCSIESPSSAVYQTSTYVQEALGKHKGFEYARTQNPTRAALEENINVLEGGAGARAFASGMAAITAVSTFAKAGDHVVCSNLTYGEVIWAQVFGRPRGVRPNF
jgi:cystathionine beta-lyase/cystathionine gamma-synthase